MSNLEYREGMTSDVEYICRLVASAIKLMDSQGIPQWDEIYPTADDFLRDIDSNTLYVATENHAIIAVYVLNRECDEQYNNASWEWDGDKACILHRFCVDATQQNKGVGTAILKHIEQQVMEMGYESLRLDVFTLNPYSLKLYRRQGYKERGFADWRKGRFILMEKKLTEAETEELTQ